MERIAAGTFESRLQTNGVDQQMAAFFANPPKASEPEESEEQNSEEQPENESGEGSGDEGSENEGSGEEGSGDEDGSEDGSDISSIDADDLEKYDVESGSEEEQGSVEEEGEEKNKKGPLPEDAKLMQKNRTIFVGNLPLELTIKQFKKLFKQYGTVESARFRSVPIRDDLPVKSKVRVYKSDFVKHAESKNGYVVFLTPSGATNALKAHNTVVEGKHLRVVPLVGSKKRSSDPLFCIFVGNLPFNATEEEVRKHFEDLCGPVDYVRLLKDSEKKGRGIGYVNFQNRESMKKALKVVPTTKYGGRTLRAERANEEALREGKRRSRMLEVPGASRRLMNKRTNNPADLALKKLVGKQSPAKGGRGGAVGGRGGREEVEQLEDEEEEVEQLEDEVEEVEQLEERGKRGKPITWKNWKTN
eukprot:TRINITY_DN726_c0_g1_i4.p1 TRINITY_DN726_c0_g1~~TRINITY_DN726_c0_g1_i4.p1  ORF type:complete len:417 (-),score=131.32 TRINITY_DN726_c0_g1_i4:107-1357(-)